MSAPQEADEVAAAKDAVLVAAFRAYSVPQGYNGAQFAALLDAFERAVEAAVPEGLREELERQYGIEIGEQVTRAMAAEADVAFKERLFAEEMRRAEEAEARLSRLEAALEEIASVCAPDGEPDSNAAANMAVDIARAALKAGEEAK